MTTTHKSLLYLVLLAGLVLAPLLGMYPMLLMKLLCFALFASAYNLLLGYTGLASFGHAAFFGGAGYVAAHAMKVWGFPPELGLLTGIVTGAFLGAIMGSLATRRHGIYFTMITLALAQIVYFVSLQAPFTGGENGLQGVPRGALFGVIDLRSDLVMYYLTLAVAALAFVFIIRVVHSPFGQVVQAVKENESRAISLGYEAYRVKVTVFVLSSALSGLAGALKALAMGFATLTDVHWMMSGHALLMTLLGGVGTLSGPLVGAAILISLENKLGDLGYFLADLTGIPWFTTLGQQILMVIGIIFVFCVLAFRRGIMGEIIPRVDGYVRKLRGQGTAPAESTERATELDTQSTEGRSG